ncbi:MAG: ATP-dependent helicase [Propionibacterium sp.]|nr:ATP-dependent helicase [Propionibacterium sp.]
MSISTPGELCDAIGIPFSDEQLAAITAPLEPGVIIAGAGTGKTAVMAARVVWLVGSGRLRPDEVLGLTFTRKAAGELAERIRGALTVSGVRTDDPDEGTEVVSTYDSFAARLVGEFGLRGGLDVEPVMITGATRYRLAERIVRGAAGPFTSVSRLSHHTVPERVLQLDSEMQSHLATTRRVSEFTADAARRFASAPGYGKTVVKAYKGMLDAAAQQEERLELLSLVEAYQRLKRELGVVEFADQLRTAEHLVRTVPSIAEDLRRRYRVVLLDEYQDTSSAQAQLLAGLFARHPVTAVGDPYQAIYGWRGAAPSNIIEFDRDFGEAGRYTLSVNRRSRTRILDVGNALASTIPGDSGVELRAPDGTGPGSVEAARFDTEEAEHRYITEQIVALGAASPWKEIAVLCRRNATMGPIYASLRALGVPVEYVGLDGLLSLPEIVPIVATMRVLDDATANPAVATLLTGARWGIGLRDMEALGRRARVLSGAGGDPAAGADAGLDLATALEQTVTGTDPGEVLCLLDAVADPPADLSDEGRARLRRFEDELSRLREHATEPVADLVQRIIRTLGIEEELLAAGDDSSQLAKFVAACGDYVAVDGDGSLAGLMAYLDAEEARGVGLEQAVITEDDSVKLLTIHRSKGLEWDHVFLPALADRVFPSDYRSGYWPTTAAVLPADLRGDRDNVPQLEDYTEQARKEYDAALKEDHGFSEDRLAYVAATRARKHLVGSFHKWSPGNVRPRKESRYFEVIWAEASRHGETLDEVSDSEVNPINRAAAGGPWPAPVGADTLDAQQAAAELVRAAADADDEWVTSSGSLPDEVAEQFGAWDDARAHVIAHRQRGQERVLRLPTGLSATALIALRDDPDAFAESLVRRMPRRPSPSAHLGTQFHEWVQQRFELPGGFDEFERHGADLTELITAFEAGQFADRAPIAVEVPFTMVAGDFQLRGRMDAVYAWDGDFDEVVVDWKTSRAPADELQLAVYRRAWAEARGIEVARVGAAFYYVRTDQLVFAGASPQLIDEALQL